MKAASDSNKNEKTTRDQFENRVGGRVIGKIALREMRKHWLRSLIIVLVIAIPIAGVMIPLQHMYLSARGITHEQNMVPLGADVQLQIQNGPIRQDAYGNPGQLEDGAGFSATSPTRPTPKPDSAPVDHLTTTKQIVPLLPKTTHVTTISSNSIRLKAAGSDDLDFPATGRVSNWGDYPKKGHIQGQLPVNTKEIALDRKMAKTLGVKVGSQVVLAMRAELPTQPLTCTETVYTVTAIVTNRPGISNNAYLPATDCKSPVAPDAGAPAPGAPKQENVESENLSLLVNGWKPKASEVLALNKLGVSVQARGPIEGLPLDLEAPDRGERITRTTLVTAFFSAQLVIFCLEIILLLIPLTALAARSWRRDLEVLYSLGATRKQLLTALVIQGAILGFAGAGVGVLLGDTANLGAAILMNRPGPSTLPPILLTVAMLIAGMISGAAGTAIAANRVVPRIEKLDSLNRRAARVFVAPRSLRLGAKTRIAVVVAIFLFGGAAITTPTLVRGLWQEPVTAAFFALPIGALAIVIGFMLLSPLSIAAINKVGSRLRSSRPWAIAARLAIRDLSHHRHRSVTAISAITIIVGGSVIATTLVHSVAENLRTTSMSAAAPGRVIVGINETLGSAQQRKNWIKAARVDVEKSIGPVGMTIIYGTGKYGSNSGNIEDGPDLEDKSTQVGISDGSPRPNPFGSPLKPVTLAPGSNAPVSVECTETVVLRPVAKRCPGMESGGRVVNDFKVDSNNPDCRNAGESAAVLVPGVSDALAIVDDGAYLSASGIFPAKNIRELTAVLRGGGIITGSHRDIDSDGSATIAVRNGCEDKLSVLSSLKLPAKSAAIRVEASSFKIISPQTAKKLGVEVVPIGAIFTPDRTIHSSDNLVSKISDNNPRINAVVPLPTRFDLYFAALVFGVSLIISVGAAATIVALGGLESERDLDLVQALGAPAKIRRYFGAFQGFIIALAALIPALIVGLGVAFMSSSAAEMVLEEQLFGTLWSRLTPLNVPVAWLILLSGTVLIASALAGFFAVPRHKESRRR